MKKFVLGLVAIVVVVVAGGYTTFKIKNQKHGPDVYAMYLNQDPTPKGKVGVFVIGLSTTEDFDDTWWRSSPRCWASIRSTSAQSPVTPT